MLIRAGEPFLYLRLRRELYSEQDLTGWAKRIERVVESGSDVFAYVKHEEGAAGALYAQRLAELVGGSAGREAG